MGSIGSFFSHAAKAVGGFVKDVVDTAVDTVATVANFAIKTILNPRSLIQDPMKVITLAIAAVFYAPTGGLSLLAWTALYSGAVNTLTTDMAKNGWIDENVAMVLNVVGTVALAWVAGGGTAPVNSGYISAIRGLEALGVSSATANILVGYAAEVSILLSSTVGTVVAGAYSIYQSIQNSLMLELQYKQALASFEAWKKTIGDTIQKEDGSVSDYVTGKYYQRMAGQPMYNVFMAGREMYIGAGVQVPNYWLDNTKPPHDADENMSKILSDYKNYYNAGNDGYMNVVSGSNIFGSIKKQDLFLA